MKAAVRSLYRRRNEKETRFQTEKTENGVFLTCTVLEADGSEMMSIRVKVADTYQADAIKEQFLNNPGLIYRGTLALLIGDVDSVGGFAALADGEAAVRKRSMARQYPCCETQKPAMTLPVRKTS